MVTPTPRKELGFFKTPAKTKTLRIMEGLGLDPPPPPMMSLMMCVLNDNVGLEPVVAKAEVAVGVVGFCQSG